MMTHVHNILDLHHFKQKEKQSYHQTIPPRSVYCIMLGWVWIVWVHSLVVRIVRIVRTGQINLETSVCSSNQQQPGSYCKAAMQILQPGQRNKDLETFLQTGQRSRNFWFYWGYDWLWLELYNKAMHRQVQAQPLVLIVSFNNVMLNHQSVLEVWNEEKIKKSFLIQKTEQKDITRKLVGDFQ